MFRIDDSTAAASLPTPEAAGTEGYYTEGVPGVTPATKVRASWLNAVQESLRGVVTGAGVTPSKTVYTRLWDAIRRAAGGFTSTITATGSLTADQAGLVNASAASAAVTLTLPLANAAGGLPKLIDLDDVELRAGVALMVTRSLLTPAEATALLADGTAAEAA